MSTGGVNWNDENPFSVGSNVNRQKSKPAYLAQRIKGLNNLDRLASFILAILHSMLRTNTYGSWSASGQFQPASSNMDSHTASEKKIQFGCVAVCVIDGTIYFGRNGVGEGLTREQLGIFLEGDAPEEAPIATDKYLNSVRDFCDVRKEGGYPNELHAEMQLVDFLGLPISRMKYVGVSKPCCQNCQSVLKTYNIKYAAGHGDVVTNWLPPPILADDFKHLTLQGTTQKARKPLKQTIDKKDTRQKRIDAMKNLRKDAFEDDIMWRRQQH